MGYKNTISAGKNFLCNVKFDQLVMSASSNF